MLFATADGLHDHFVSVQVHCNFDACTRSFEWPNTLGLPDETAIDQVMVPIARQGWVTRDINELHLCPTHISSTDEDLDDH